MPQDTFTIPVKVATELLPQLSKAKMKLVLEAIQETYKLGYEAGVKDAKATPRP